MIRAVTSLSGRKPVSTRDNARKLRISSPAAITSMMERATSAIAREPRRRRDTDTAAPRPAAFRDSVSAVRDASKAGAKPNASPVNTASPTVKINTSQSTCTSTRRGVSPGSRDLSAERPNTARRNPNRAPTAASKTLSVSNCRAMRWRPAPRAERIPISFCREAARDRVKFATLAQAISRMIPTAPSSNSSRVRTSATMPFRSAITVTSAFHALGMVQGNKSNTRDWNRRISAPACALVTPV